MTRKVLLVLAFFTAVSVFVFGFAFADKSAIPESELLKPIDFASESYVSQYLLRPITGYVPGLAPTTDDSVVGPTCYDQQHNAAQPKMIANDYQGGGKGQHFTWMRIDELFYPGCNRYVDYRYNKTDGSFKNKVVIGAGVETAGYTGLDIFNENYPEGASYAAVIYHNSGLVHPEDLPRRAMIALDRGTSAGAGTFVHYDIPESLETMAEAGMWPHGGIDSCGNIHVVLLEGATAAGISPMGYIRCTRVGDLLKCEGPGVGPYHITAETPYDPIGDADSNKIAELDLTGTISYIVVADPNSKKVALVWPKCIDPENYQNNQDVFYLESENCGDDWIAADTFADFTYTNITQWKPDDPYRTYADIAGVYDLEHNLHIFWNAHYLKDATDEYDPYDVKLMHWSEGVVQECPTGDTVRYSVVAAAKNEIGEVVPWAWNRTLGKMSAGVGIEGSCKAGWLFLVWQQFNKGDLSEAENSNGELYFSFSTNLGISWSAPRNLTNTPDSGCAAGECDSEGWPSLADRVDDYMHIQYILDRDAGVVVQDEGGFTQNYAMYKKEPVCTLTAVAAPRIDWSPRGVLVKPWLAVDNNGKDSVMFTITNAGTATLTGNLSETAPWLSIDKESFDMPEGPCPDVFWVTIDAFGYSETFLQDSIYVTSNDENFYVNVNVVVSDEYYAPEFVMVENGIFSIYESNVGNIGHQIEEGQMFVVSDSFGPVFDGSVILGYEDPEYSPLIGRWIFEERFMLAESPVQIDSLKAVNAIKITKKFSPINPIPPKFKWRWITVEEVELIFYSGNPDDHERFIKKMHLRVYKNPKPSWWGDDTTTTNPPMYFGMAIDFDLPSDTGNVWNIPGFDEDLYLLYQQGFGETTTPQGNPYDSLFAGIADLSDNPPYGGHIIPNDVYVYPQSGYRDDSLYAVMSTPGFSVRDPKDTAGVRTDDYSCVMTQTLIPGGIADGDTFEFNKLIVVSAEGLDVLKIRVRMYKCGDANRNGKVNLGDARYIANYKFGVGPEPFLYLSDVKGTCTVDIGDAKYLANYYLGKPGFETLYCGCGM